MTETFEYSRSKVAKAERKAKRKSLIELLISIVAVMIVAYIAVPPFIG